MTTARSNSAVTPLVEDVALGGRRDFVCGNCGYGISVNVLPGSCPMCQRSTWRLSDQAASRRLRPVSVRAAETLKMTRLTETSSAAVVTQSAVAALAASERPRGLVESGIALGSELSLESLLLRLVETAAELTEARYGALGVIAQAGTGWSGSLRSVSPTRRSVRSAGCRAAAAVPEC